MWNWITPKILESIKIARVALKKIQFYCMFIGRGNQQSLRAVNWRWCIWRRSHLLISYEIKRKWISLKIDCASNIAESLALHSFFIHLYFSQILVYFSSSLDSDWQSTTLRILKWNECYRFMMKKNDEEILLIHKLSGIAHPLSIFHSASCSVSRILEPDTNLKCFIRNDFVLLIISWI